MKNLITILSILLIISSCNSRKDAHAWEDEKVEINCLYQGGIIIQKDTIYFIYPPHYTIKYKGEIIKARYYEIDNKYKVGDTINKPCVGKEF